MRTFFYNAKIKGTWCEVYIISERGDKNRALKIFRKFDPLIQLKDIYSSINAPNNCPTVFTSWLNDKKP